MQAMTLAAMANIPSKPRRRFPVAGVPACRHCGATERSHKARGLCVRCYDALQGKGQLGRYSLLSAGGARPRVRATCARCGRRDSPIRDLGVCYDCYTYVPAMVKSLVKEQVQAALRAIGGVRARQAHRICRAVCAVYSIGIGDLFGPRRLVEWTEPRRIAAYLLHEDARLTFAEVAAVMAGRDHSTAMHHYKRATDLLRMCDSMTEWAIRAVREECSEVAS